MNNWEEATIFTQWGDIRVIVEQTSVGEARVEFPDTPGAIVYVNIT